MLKAVFAQVIKGLALLGGSLVLVASVQAQAAEHVEGRGHKLQPECTHEFVPNTQSKEVYMLKNKRNFEVLGFCTETI